MRGMKYLIVLLALLASRAYAQTITVSWDPVTQYEDGTVITQPVTYRVYGGVQGDQSLRADNLTSTTHVRTAVEHGRTYCYRVTAVVDGVESSQSEDACLTLVAPKKIPARPMRIELKSTTTVQ